MRPLSFPSFEDTGTYSYYKSKGGGCRSNCRQQSEEDSSSAAFLVSLKSLSFIELSIAISFSFQRNKCL